MTDAPQGEGWWQATDGKWYSPEQHPAAAAQTSAVPGAGTGAPQQPAGDAEETEDQKKGKGKVIAIVVVVLLLLAAAAGGVLLLTGDDDTGSDSDPSGQDDIGDATDELTDDGPIEFDTEYEDSLEGTRTEARYTLDAPDGAIMTLTVTNDEASQSGVFTSFGSTGERFADFRVQPGASETETIILANDGGAPFELIFTEGPAAYTFKVGLEIQDDADEGGDAGSESGTAFTIDAGQDVSGMLGGQDTTDHYTLELKPGTEFTMEAAVDRAAERGVFFKVDFEGSTLFSERIQPGAETTFSLLLDAEDEGTLDIIATEGPADYSFTADFVPQNEGGASGDSPADLASARTIDPASPIQGQVGGRDLGDYYLFAAPAGTITVTGSAEATSERAYSITLEDESGGRIAFFRVQPGAESAETVEVGPGTTVRMLVAEGPAAYSIRVG